MADFTITGLPSLDRKLKALEPRVAKKVVRQALRKGAKRVQARVKQLAPKGPTGQTRKAVKVRAFKRSRKGTIGVKVRIEREARTTRTRPARSPTWGPGPARRPLSPSARSRPAHGKGP
jgi:HK97 gp10 family phage protein